MILSPSCEATHPPTPITKLGFFAFNGINLPRWLNTLSSAFSRTEQVFSKITSASSGVRVSTMPSVEANISAIRDESYSFIWQPKVLMNTFFGASTLAENDDRGIFFVFKARLPLDKTQF